MNNEIQSGLRTYLVDLFESCSSTTSPVFHNQYPIISIFNPSKKVKPDLYLAIDDLKFVIGIYDPKKDNSITRMHLDPLFSYILLRQAEIGVLFILDENSTNVSYTTGFNGAQALIRNHSDIWKRITKITISETDKKVIERYPAHRDEDFEYRVRIGEIDSNTLNLFTKISKFFTKIQSSHGSCVLDSKRSYILDHLKRVEENSLRNMNLLSGELNSILHVVDESFLQNLFNSLTTYHQIGDAHPDYYYIHATALGSLATWVEHFTKMIYHKTYVFSHFIPEYPEKQEEFY